MLEQYIHQTLSKLNRSLDNISFTELVNETQHLRQKTIIISLARAIYFQNY